VCQTYIRQRKLVVVRKQTGMDKVYTLRGRRATAQARLDHLPARSTPPAGRCLSFAYDEAVDRHPLLGQGSRYGSGNSDADTSVARMRKCLRSNRCCAASRIQRSSRIPATSPGSPDMVDAALSGKNRHGERHHHYKKWVRGAVHLLKPVVVDKPNEEKV